MLQSFASAALMHSRRIRDRISYGVNNDARIDGHRQRQMAAAASFREMPEPH